MINDAADLQVLEEEALSVGRWNQDEHARKGITKPLYLYFYSGVIPPITVKTYIHDRLFTRHGKGDCARAGLSF